MIRALAILLALAIAAAGAQTWRLRALQGQIQAERAAAAEHALALWGERTQALQAASAAHEATRRTLAQRQQIITREVEHVVDRPSYRAECLDPDGLRILRAAIAGADPAPAGEPGQPLPASP